MGQELTYYAADNAAALTMTAAGGTTKVVTFSSLAATSDEGISTPTFSTAPKVKVLNVDKERFVFITGITTTQFQLNSPGSSGDDLPVEVDIEIEVRGAETVSGPTPATDFSGDVIEPMCTPLDIRLKHTRFTPNAITNAKLMIHCIDARAAIETALDKYYSESTMQTTPWASPVVPDAIYEDPEGVVDNEEDSLASDAIDRSGLAAVAVATTNTTVFTQQWDILFSDTSNFTVTAQTERGMGSGNTATNFTSGNGDITINKDAWFGNFEIDNGFHFSTYRWYRQLVKIAKFVATGLAMLDHYGDDQEIEQSTAIRYLKIAAEALKKYSMPDSPGGTRLPSLGKRQARVLAKPYDVNFLGQNLTRVTSGNTDDVGEKGERFDPFGLIATEGSALDIFGF